MPISQDLMDDGEWSVDLREDTPTWVLNAIDVRAYLWATIVITPQGFPEGAITDANILANARYTGVYMGMGPGRKSLYGPGLAWWLGTDGEGPVYASTDFTTGAASFSTLMTNQVFSRSNGITAGTIDATATTFTIDIEGGDSAREILDTLCGMAPGGPNFWRLNTGGTLDADDQATLWPTATTPTSILTQDGGRDGNITGLAADLDLDALDGSDVRSNVQVDWNDGTNNGSATVTLPSTVAAFDGTAPAYRQYLDSNPKRPKPPTKRWRKVATWGINNQTRANTLATREANERTNVTPEITATLHDCYDPWRFTITPGNTVYVHDLDQKLYDTTKEVYYRGEALHPTTGRVDQMTTPIQEGYGVYLRYWTGAAFAYYRLTPYVEFEEGPTTLKLNHRDRFPASPARAGRVNRRQWTRWARRAARRERRKERRQNRRDRD